MNEKHYKLRFLPLFEEDLNEIVDYITHRLKTQSPQTHWFLMCRRRSGTAFPAQKHLNSITRQRSGSIRTIESLSAIIRSSMSSWMMSWKSAESFTADAISSARSESLVQNTVHRTLHHSNLIILSQIVGGRLPAAVWLFFVVGRFGDV